MDFLDYWSRNCKCKKYDQGHLKKDHDFYLNYHGSAKSIKSDLAAKIISWRKIFETCNVQTGVLCGDDNKSTISKVQEKTNYDVVRLSDTNHTAKGVCLNLYKLKKDTKNWIRMSSITFNEVLHMPLLKTKEI